MALLSRRIFAILRPDKVCVGPLRCIIPRWGTLAPNSYGRSLPFADGSLFFFFETTVFSLTIRGANFAFVTALLGLSGDTSSLFVLLVFELSFVLAPS